MSGKTSRGSGGYAVGYGKPPSSRRFRKGVSGNPLGRPKQQASSPRPSPGAPKLEDLCLQEFYRPIEIRENGKMETVPMIRAVLRSLGVSAARGNYRAQMALVGLAQATEERQSTSRQQLFETVIDYKEHWQQVFADCDRRGVPRPEVVPHPDDLAINGRTAEVVFNGPFDDAEKAQWDRMLEIRKESEDTLEKLQKRTRKKGDGAQRQETIEALQSCINYIDAILPSESVRRQPDFNIWEWREWQKKDTGNQEEI